MEVKINLSLKDIPYIMNLALAGCVELLEYPELCSLKNDGWEPPRNYYDNKDSWWHEKGTLVHGLAYNGFSKILDYPQYLKIKNKCGVTPLHLLAQSLIPEHRRRDEALQLSSEDIAVIDKILKIEGLCDLKAKDDTTPLHYIAELGYIPLLDYPGVETVESPEYNCHGTPMTLLYRHASDGLDRLLKHPHIMTEYKTHGSPLSDLSYNKILRPTVKVLREYNFKMTKKWHSSKKLDRGVIADMLSVPQAIRFMIY